MAIYLSHTIQFHEQPLQVHKRLVLENKQPVFWRDWKKTLLFLSVFLSVSDSFLTFANNYQTIASAEVLIWFSWNNYSVSAIFGDVLEPCNFTRHPLFRISASVYAIAWTGLVNMDGFCKDLRTSISANLRFFVSWGSMLRTHYHSEQIVLSLLKL